MAGAASEKLMHARLSGSGAAVADAGDTINARFGYLEVKCLGCDTHRTVALVRAEEQTQIDTAIGFPHGQDPIGRTNFRRGTSKAGSSR
jgi:hypothetical protein